MTVLQQLNLNPTTAVLLVVGLCALCLVMPVLLSGLHVITAIVTAFTHLIGGAFHLISGGPGVWCGCLVTIGGCGFIVLVVWLIANGLSSCSTNPTNFCALFGR